MTGPAAPSVVPAGATGEGDGIKVGAGPVRVDLFIDFMCPFCRRFELSAGPALERLLHNDQASVVYHPMNFLDAASRKFIGWYTTLAWSLCSRRSSAGPAESSNRRQNGHMKSMNRSTRTGPAPTLIPSPSPVAPAGTTLGAAGPVIGLSFEGNPGSGTLIRLTPAGMSGHPYRML